MSLSLLVVAVTDLQDAWLSPSSHQSLAGVLLNTLRPEPRPIHLNPGVTREDGVVASSRRGSCGLGKVSSWCGGLGASTRATSSQSGAHIHLCHGQLFLCHPRHLLPHCVGRSDPPKDREGAEAAHISLCSWPPLTRRSGPTLASCPSTPGVESPCMRPTSCLNQPGAVVTLGRTQPLPPPHCHRSPPPLAQEVCVPVSLVAAAGRKASPWSQVWLSPNILLQAELGFSVMTGSARGWVQGGAEVTLRLRG